MATNAKATNTKYLDGTKANTTDPNTKATNTKYQDTTIANTTDPSTNATNTKYQDATIANTTDPNTRSANNSANKANEALSTRLHEELHTKQKANTKALTEPYKGNIKVLVEDKQPQDGLDGSLAKLKREQKKQAGSSLLNLLEQDSCNFRTAKQSNKNDNLHIQALCNKFHTNSSSCFQIQPLSLVACSYQQVL